MYNLKGASKILIDIHHGPRVIELPTVIDRTEHSDQLAIGKELVPLLHNLVGPAYQVQIVFVQEGLDHVAAEYLADAALHIRRPPRGSFLGVRPQQVAHKPVLRDLDGPRDAADLLQVLQLGAETPVHAQYLLPDDCGHRHHIEHVREYLPQLQVVLSLALVVEPVDPVDARALVVAPQHEEVLGVLDLVGQEQAYALDGLLAPVHVVPQEQVVDIAREAPLLEYLDEIPILPMDIAYTITPNSYLQS